MSDDWQKGGFGLYIHWPFCLAKCPYCDFNSHVSAAVDQAQWQAAYLSEIERYGVETSGRTLNTVFFGGGTPSLMDPDLVHAVLDKIRATWPISNSFEVTLEANPTSVEAGRFAGYRDAGVNRISMGIQALNDADLKRLGRMHSVAEARTAFDTARSLFQRVSFDLIYTRQHQCLPDWTAELREALSMAIDHLSLYQLTIEDGTAFGDRYAIGRLPGLPSDDLGAQMYEATQEICEAAGMPAYEISNHARDMAESRHNLIYWRYGDYVGIGPGAHGRITKDRLKFATETPSSPGDWLTRVNERGEGERERTQISGPDQAVEYLMMSLRLLEGSSLSRFEALNGASVPKDRLDMLQEEGFVIQDGDRLRTTAAGRPLLNAILRELLV
ncbi:radical SAM family heme chaperone HemW [Nioella nitratireducens]|uniref:radical SAM family heme chaperone HemW n=1 Tax=Nioella nitratireducens TaxID=1287720 RepID=UPI0008FD50CD|nr:radical SAM family heme chaperone HemW [Nioella nitratireducens]